MSIDWKVKSRELTNLRKNQKYDSLEVEEQSGPMYSESELTDSIKEIGESIGEAESELQQSISGLELLRLQATLFPSTYSEEELQKIAEDAERLEKLQALHEGTEESMKIMDRIRENVEFATSESNVPQIANALQQEKDLVSRIRQLEQSSLAHASKIQSLHETTAQLVEALDKIEIEKLAENTVELEKLLQDVSGNTHEPLPETLGIDPELANRIRRLRVGTDRGTLAGERLKSSISELEEIAKTSNPMTRTEIEITDLLNRLREGSETKHLALNELKQSVEELELLAQSADTSEEGASIVEDQLEQLELLQNSTQSLQQRLEKVDQFQEEMQELQNQVQTQGLGSLQELGTASQEVIAKLFGSEEDKTAFNEYRKLWAQFRPNLAFAERLSLYEKSTDESNGVGQQILDGYAQAENLKDSQNYPEAIKQLKQLFELVKTQRQEIEGLKQSIALETEGKVGQREEAFSFTTKTENGSFDTDSDASNFFLANSLGTSGTLEMSPRLKNMRDLFEEAIEQANKLRKLGATPEEIGRVALKGIPKAFWPDWMIKEIEAFKRAHQQIQAELIQQQVDKESEGQVESVLEKQSQLVDMGNKVNEFLEILEVGDEKVREEAKGVFEDMGSQLSLLENSYAIGKNLVELFGPGESVEDNPVKAKMIEFQRNRIIIETTNKLVSLGLDLASEVIPAIGLVTSGKDAVLEICKAIEYFDMLYNVKKAKTGAKIDPRSAMYLPFCEIASEKKIQASDAVIKAISAVLKTIGKGLETGGVTGVAGLVVEKVGDALKIGGKIVIQGIKWNKARKAHNYLKKAIGPPPIRKAMEKVQKYNTKYARHILVQSALDNDPWALDHFEDIGLGKTDLDNPNTTATILREYITLSSGGKLGDQVSEDQERFQDSGVGKVALAIKGGAEKVRDLVIGRSTSAEYDPSWMPKQSGISRTDWQLLKKDAVQAGWYDNRLKLGNLINEYEQIKTEYDPKNLDSTFKYYAMLARLREGVADVHRSAKTNDQKTAHAGMQQACSRWMDLIDVYLGNVVKDRDELVNAKYKSLSESEKKKQIDQELNQAKKKQEEKRNEKYAERVKTVQKTLLGQKLDCSLGSFKLSDDPKVFIKTLQKKITLDEKAISDITSFLINLKSQLIERLMTDLEASTDKEFESNLKQSLVQLVEDTGQLMRTMVEQVHEASERRGNRSTVNWQPKSSDYIYDSSVLKNMLKSAKEFQGPNAWDGHKSKPLIKAMEKLAKAKNEFDQIKLSYENQNPQSPTVEKKNVDKKLGLYLGELDSLESALRNFDPITKQGLTHPGLVLYRQEMLDTKLETRMTLDIESEDWK